MRLLTPLPVVLAVAMMAGCATSAQQQADVQPPTQSRILQGRWTSTQYAGAGGSLLIEMFPAIPDGTFDGKIFFYNSACQWLAPMKGTIKDGKIAIATELGGKCGHVDVLLEPSGKGFVGSYRADYPDVGDVYMQ